LETTLVHICSSIVLTILGVPVAVFSLECLLGTFYKKSRSQQSSERSDTVKAAILIPAHNEELVISATLKSVADQICEQDLVLVVADNCQDSTAAIVREFGFEVVERTSDSERGKGYALNHGINHLKSLSETPDIVIVVDADCLLAEGALDALKHAVLERDLPVQACYLMKRGNVERLAVKVSEFAFMVKNKIRLRGLSRMNMPVPLTGTGMAFPWAAITSVKLATGDIVEDMRLGVELAEQGKGATYCDEALVYSYFPSSEEAEKTQRERWEHGHLGTLIQFAPRLLKRAVAKLSVKAFGMMLDLAVPPLSLLVILIAISVLAFVIQGLGWGIWTYFLISLGYLITLFIVIFLAWQRHGKQILSAQEMCHIPVYIVSKIAVYIAYIARKQTKWIRTDRH
jgi:cellulose synthase/poly-beta-1,6-N-acetylglucosamine synthase-like glycosyltransferase